MEVLVAVLHRRRQGPTLRTLRHECIVGIPLGYSDSLLWGKAIIWDRTFEDPKARASLLLASAAALHASNVTSDR